MTDKQALYESMMTSASGVLGSMLIDPEVVGPMLMKVSESDFQLTEQRKVFCTIASLYSEGAAPDGMLVGDRLGGEYRQYLADLINATTTSANADAYAKELKSKSRRWRMQEIGEALINAEDEEEQRKFVDKANLLLCERSSVRRMSMEQGYREFWERKDGTGENYLTWGFFSLDRKVHAGNGDVIVIGGRPSSGKTALSLQFGVHIAESRRVGFFSYETSVDKLYDRIVACQAQVSFSHIMRNHMEKEDYAKIKSSHKALTAPSLELIEATGMTVNDIFSYAMAHHYDVIIIDYLQKIPAPGIRENIQRVSQVSNDLQQSARLTKKSVIALSQLRRGDSDKAPTMADLRESGQIEQDADVIMMLYKEDASDPRSRRVLDVAKNKDGEPDLGILLNFDGDKQTFSPVKKEPQGSRKEDPPVGRTEAYYESIAKRAAEMNRDYSQEEQNGKL